jgi:N-acetylmuramoyl-L-alanine amidase
MAKTGRCSQACLAALAALLGVAAFAVSGARQADASPTTQDLYGKAQRLEAALEVQPGGTRTETDYRKVIEAYQTVERHAQTPLFAAPSMIAIGRLYDEMGRLFDTSYFQKALETYQYLLRVYPHSRLAPEALYAIAQLESGPLEAPVPAKKTLESLIATYPSSDQADRARLALAKPTPTSTSSENNSQNSPPSESRTAREKNVSTAGEPLNDQPEEGGKEASRPTLVRSIGAEQLRDFTRVIVHLAGPVKFRSAEIEHPERFYFDLSRAYLIHPHGMRLKVDSPFLSSVEMAQNEPYVVRVVFDVQPGVGYSVSLLSHPYRLAIEVGKRASGNSAAASAARESAANADAGTGETAAGEIETEEELATKGNLTPAKPMHSGATSLTRELGLKIDRIVIDPGHGGFDTGAIGPTGLEEKTVALEIAMDLGRLIHQRLPGPKVFYTRDNDAFVPLEERTQIANQDKADLFISIHANSSTDPEAHGVSVYYLNFATSPEAIAVAARENALAQAPIHKLQDLLKQISLNNKIEESQELALDVDHSLFDEIRLANVHAENRGVKKAPFVVLIGAHMPSILVEVPFISNPTDERRLKERAYRERIALGIFNGVERYLSSLNSLTFKEANTAPDSER